MHFLEYTMSPFRVLIIDASVPSAVELQSLLKQACPEVETEICETAVAASRRFLETHFHLVLLPVCEYSGMNVAEMKLLRYRGIHFALVAVVDTETEITRSLASAAGANIFLLRKELPEYAKVILESCSRWSPLQSPVSLPSAHSAQDPSSACDNGDCVEGTCEPELKGAEVSYQPVTSSHPWCRVLESACWELCHSTDLPPLPGGRESCTALSTKALRTGTKVSGTCPGGLKITAEPKTNSGRPSCLTQICSEPSRQLSELVTVSELYGVSLHQLQELSRALAPTANNCHPGRTGADTQQVRPSESLDQLAADFTWLTSTEKPARELVTSLLHQILNRSSLDGAGVLMNAGTLDEYSAFISRQPDGTTRTQSLTLCDNVHRRLLDFAAPVSIEVRQATSDVAAVIENESTLGDSYAFPLRNGRFTVGTLVISSHGPFTSGELRTLWNLSELLAMAIERALLRKQLEAQAHTEVAGDTGADVNRPVSPLLKSDLKTLHQHSLEIAKDLENSVAIATAEMRQLLASRSFAELPSDGVQTINDIAASLQNLIRELQSPGQSLTSHGQLSCSVTDVLLLSDAWLRHNGPSNVRIVRELPENLWKIQSEKTLVQRCLLNIVRNACETVSSGGEVRISARNEGNSDVTQGPGNAVVLEISGTGNDMAAETHVRVFEPCLTTKSITSSTGFALTNIDSLLQRVGGRIEISSRPGMGYTVRLRLPATAQTDQTNRRSSDSLPNNRHGLVLLVDDDDSVRNVLSIMLKRAGYQVYACAGGAEASEFVRQSDRPIDYFVCDATLQPVSGMELARKLQGQLPHLKTLLISGFGKGDGSATEVSKGSMPWLQKPFTGEELIQRLSVLASGNEATAIA